MMNTLSVTEISVVTERNGNTLLELTPQDEMPDWGFTLAAVVLFLIGFFGFFLNLFVIILMCKDIQVSRSTLSLRDKPHVNHSKNFISKFSRKT